MDPHGHTPGGAARRARWQPPARVHTRGYGWLYQQHVLQANRGCDFDFLVRGDGDSTRSTYP